MNQCKCALQIVAKILKATLEHTKQTQEHNYVNENRTWTEANA